MMLLNNYQGLNNNRVSEINQNIIRRLLFINEQVGIAELSKDSGLSIPAVSRIIDILKEKDEIEVCKRNGGRGQSAGWVRLRAVNDRIICINVAPFKIEYLTVDGLGRPLNLVGTVNKPLTTPQNLIDILEEIISSQIKIFPQSQLKVAIALHGQVDRKNGISLVMPQAPWHEPLHIKYLLERKFRLEVRCDNDCVMRALAQKWAILREHRDERDFCVINVDYGVGSSFVINGNIYRGSMYGSGQIGHTVVDPNGSHCSCGRFGCLETIISQKAILDTVNRHLKLSQNLSSELSWDDVVQAYHADELAVKTIVDYAAATLGRSIYNFLNIININQIFIYGAIRDFGQTFLDNIHAQLGVNLFDDSKDEVSSVATLCKYGELDARQQLSGISYLYAGSSLYSTIL